MKQLKIWHLLFNPETRSHFITRCWVGSPDAKVAGNNTLGVMPSDNTDARVSLCFTSIVWSTSALMKIILGFLRSGSDDACGGQACLWLTVASQFYNRCSEVDNEKPISQRVIWPGGKVVTAFLRDHTVQSASRTEKKISYDIECDKLSITY